MIEFENIDAYNEYIVSIPRILCSPSLTDEDMFNIRAVLTTHSDDICILDRVEEIKVNNISKKEFMKREEKKKTGDDIKKENKRKHAKHWKNGREQHND